MPLTRKTISQFRNQMDKLEMIFNDLIHSGISLSPIQQGFQVDEFMNRFFLVMDKRIKAFMDSIDAKIMMKEAIMDESDIPHDF